MQRNLLRLVPLGATVVILMLLAPLVGALAHSPATTSSSPNFTVFATGLNDPRGLTFGPDGNLYVAEGGKGGSHSTVGQCKQVPAPVGPYTGGFTARISEISSTGVRSTVVDHLPSDQTSPALGSHVSGVADVKFLGNTLYALLAGGGCSHGNPSVPNGIIKVNQATGNWFLDANLSHFIKAHPVRHPNPPDFEPDGTWYSMTETNGNLYAVEPNHGELDQVTPSGSISRVIDISAIQGHIVPTAVAFHDGNFYIGNLALFVPGAAHIFKVTPGGQISTVVSGLTDVLGVTFDRCGRLYALEAATGKSGIKPGTGKVVRVTHAGTLETVASGLSFPTAMTFGPDGKLYVSNFGFGFPAGAGQVVRMSLGIHC